MSADPTPRRPPLPAALVSIIAFKCVKAAAFLLVGGVALRVARVARDSEPMALARAVGVSEARWTVRQLAAVLSAFTPGQVQAFGLAAILIGLVFAFEGTCLALRIAWAPYLSIVLTALAIPVEIFEIGRRPGHLRGWVLLAINLAILVYLWRRRDAFRTPAPDSLPR